MIAKIVMEERYIVIHRIALDGEGAERRLQACDAFKLSLCGSIEGAWQNAEKTTGVPRELMVREGYVACRVRAELSDVTPLHVLMERRN